MTDGRKRYALRLVSGGLMPASLVEDLLYHFLGEGNADLLRTDFHLDPLAED